jgi:hypothetical protein
MNDIVLLNDNAQMEDYIHGGGKEVRDSEYNNCHQSQPYIHNKVQIDFANKYIGGGALRNGMVQ